MSDIDILVYDIMIITIIDLAVSTYITQFVKLSSKHPCTKSCLMISANITILLLAIIVSSKTARY